MGFLIGSFFWWYQIVINNKLSFLTELVGSAVSVEQGSYLQIVYQHFISFLLFAPTVILGIRPPWNTFMIGKYLISNNSSFLDTYFRIFIKYS